ncbi:MAG: murein L,D-transpeptidase catalytic domain family protein [Chitinophagaceae bacterium]
MKLKKLALCLSVLSLCALIQLSASALKHAADAAVVSNSPTKVKEYISDVYKSIDFKGAKRLSAEVFDKAMRGYLNLQSAGKLDNDREILSIADFSESSTQPRLWVIDLKAKSVRFNTYVAHGQGSGEDFATTFSNKNGTHASSIGFYVTADTYQGQHGNSLRLNGMDNGYNDAALDRGIVVHAANYVSKENIAEQGRLGRSWGCPALAPEVAQPIINTIKGGTCLFIYYPQPQYLASAYWLNKKVEFLPENLPLHLVAPGLEKEHLADFQKPTAPTVDAAKTGRL